MLNITSRQEALSKGLKRYFTGRPCKHGHVAERFTSGSQCVGCEQDQAEARRQKYRARNLEKIRARGRKRYRENPGCHRKYRGLPEPTRPEPKLCECCGRPPKGRWERLHLDHNHETGEFRGWLCHKCNLGIGQLGDSAPGLAAALRYIQNTRLSGANASAD